MTDDLDLTAAASHVIYEVDALGRFYSRTVEFDRDGPADLRVACLEATLLHARVLIEFLVGRPRDQGGRKRSRNDIVPEDFGVTWPVSNGQLFDGYLELIDKHLAHLSRTRIQPLELPWALERIVRAVVTEFWNFADAVQRAGNPFADSFSACAKAACEIIEATTPMRRPGE